jgi:hypothetical protein
MDRIALPDLLNQTPRDEQIGTETTDGACDSRRCHTAIPQRDAVPILPVRKKGRTWNEAFPTAIARNETLLATRNNGRDFWKRRTGYHARSRIDSRMRGLIAFGEHIAARDPDCQTARSTSASHP